MTVYSFLLSPCLIISYHEQFDGSKFDLVFLLDIVKLYVSALINFISSLNHEYKNMKRRKENDDDYLRSLQMYSH